MKKLCVLHSIWLVAGAALAQALPPLNFDAPPGFSGGGDEVATFSVPEGDLVIHIYPFRRLGVGNFKARFRETLLREFVAPSLREGKPAAAPQIEAFNVEGAEAALIGKFAEEKHARTRVAMLASGAVAIIDITAAKKTGAEGHWGGDEEGAQSVC